MLEMPFIIKHLKLACKIAFILINILNKIINFPYGLLSVNVFFLYLFYLPLNPGSYKMFFDKKDSWIKKVKKPCLKVYREGHWIIELSSNTPTMR